MSATRRRAEQVLADKYGPSVGEWGAALLDDAGLLTATPQASAGEEPGDAAPLDEAPAEYIAHELYTAWYVGAHGRGIDHVTSGGRVLARLNRCAPPTPEVVSYEAAAARLARCYERMTNCGHDDLAHCVRASFEPAPPLAVGDTAKTTADLDRLPAGAVVRTPRGLAAQKCEPIAKNVWEMVGRSTAIVNGDACLLPARVLDLPEAES